MTLPRLASALLILAAFFVTHVSITSVSAQAAPYCAPGQEPEFLFGFARLKQQLGVTMGEPHTCEHTDPATGDTLQYTSAGLAYYRPSTNTPAFTDGFNRWALRDGRLISWQGENTDPPTAANFDAYWVMTHRATELWSGPDGNAVPLGRARAWNYFQVVKPQESARLPIMNPLTQGFAYIDVAAVGPIPAPTAAELAAIIAGPELIGRPNLPGRIVTSALVRTWPRVDTITATAHTLAHNTPIWIDEAVRGDDGETWYRIGNDEYIQAERVRLPRTPDQTFPGRWMDADLNEPALLVAYEGDRPVYSALAVIGRVASQTPTGVFAIQRRVENETMDSTTIGIPKDGPGGYFLENVLHTQYFTGDGAAIHNNWWLSSFGYAGSQGCLGLNLADSRWFWDWATIGTPLVVRR